MKEGEIAQYTRRRRPCDTVHCCRLRTLERTLVNRIAMTPGEAPHVMAF
jgi:hypothetical protein